MADENLTPEIIASVEAKRKREAEEAAAMLLQPIVNRIVADARKAVKSFPDMTDKATFTAHSRLVIYIANKICLAGQGRQFIVDEHNRDVLRFLLYYFNNCPLAESVFPGKKHKLHKHILLMGNVGTGKTLMMQIFSEYLRYTNNPNHFHNASVTEMVNYFTIHNNIDRYVYNEEGSRGFQCKPVNLCLNDIGVELRPFYGIDTKQIINDFLHARNEIWTMTAPDQRKFAHLTTNLDKAKLLEVFADGFGRLADRFKTYNIIKLTGESRR